MKFQENLPKFILNYAVIVKKVDGEKRNGRKILTKNVRK